MRGSESMNIYVLNGLSGIENIIDVFQSVVWNMQYYADGDFDLSVPGNTKNVSMLTVGKYLVREADINASGGTETFRNVMIIEKRVLSYDADEGWILTLTGGSLKRILARRIIWEQMNFTGGTAENAIRSAITQNVIDPAITERQIQDFILGPAKGYTDTITAQAFGENLADWVTSVCKQYGYGWDIYISGNKYVFDLYKGTDRTYDQNEVIPVVFSPEFDNLLASTYTDDRTNYKNTAMIGGEGEGDAKKTASVGTSSGLSRFEAYYDGSSYSSNDGQITDQEYLAMLRTFGAEELGKTHNTEKVEGEVLPAGMYTLNQDFFLGDLVQIINDHGISAQSRILEIIYSEDASGIKLTPTFGEWEDE